MSRLMLARWIKSFAGSLAIYERSQSAASDKRERKVKTRSRDISAPKIDQISYLKALSWTSQTTGGWICWKISVEFMCRMAVRKEKLTDDSAARLQVTTIINFFSTHSLASSLGTHREELDLSSNFQLHFVFNSFAFACFTLFCRLKNYSDSLS